MPEYLAPGVYIEERAGRRTIEGVSTSTAGFVGVTERGRVQGPPTLVTSYGDFERSFGSFLPIRPDTLGEHGHLPLAVKHFFDNGGKRCFISRVFAQRNAADLDADRRTLALSTGTVARLRSNTSAESAVNPVPPQRILVSTLRGFGVGGAVPELRRQLGGTALTPAPTYTAWPAAGQIQLDPGLNAAAGTFLAKNAHVVLQPIGAANNTRIIARDPGMWGEDVRIQVRPINSPPARLTGVAANTLTVSSASSFYLGCTIELRRLMTTGQLQDLAYATVIGITGNNLTIAAPTPALPGYAATDAVEVSVAEVEVLVEWRSIVETYRGSWRWMTTANTGYTAEQREEFNLRRSVWGELIREGSQLVLVRPTQVANYAEATPLASHPTTADGQPANLAPWTGIANAPAAPGEPDLLPGIPNYLGNPGAGPGQRRGIAALSDEDTISLVAAPGITGSVVQEALITHAELMRYRFAVLDGPKSSDIAAIRTHRGNFDSKYAALYYPWVASTNPETGAELLVPPAGITLGIYARSDGERGVHKAPANELLRGARRLELKISHGEQEVLNPEGINVIRDFSEIRRGIRVWGARTISSDPEWRYVSVRRLFNYLEHSIFKSTQWVVFEPNNHALWAAVRRTIETFLEAEWRKGALFGAKANDAFYVKCDESTMAQIDLDQGRLVCEIGVAPTKPAEFVIFRIGQYTADRSS